MPELPTVTVTLLFTDVDTSWQAADENFLSFALMNRIGQDRGWGPMCRVRYH